MSNKKAKGRRKKSRSKLSADGKKPTLTAYLRDVPIGSIVQIDICGSYPKGMPHQSFQGMVGKVVGKRGSALEVRIQGPKPKLVVVAPVHVKEIR
jgi:ribosomal protein L21E